MAETLKQATKEKFKKFLMEKAVKNKAHVCIELMEELEKLETLELLENVNQRLFDVIQCMGAEYELRQLEAYRSINNVLTSCSEESLLLY